MQVILVSFGSYGDINPFIWMAKILNENGHQAVIISNRVFQNPIEKEGITFYGIGNNSAYNEVFESIDLTSADNKPRDMFKNLKMFIKTICFDPIDETINIIQRIKDDNTLIMNSMLAFGATLAAYRFSIPQKTIALSPTVISSFDVKMGFIKKYINSSAFKMLYGNFLNKKVKELEIDLPSANIPNWLFSNGVLTLFPKWFMDFNISNNSNIDFVGFPEITDEKKLPEDLLTFLKNNPQPVVFTPGTPFRHNTKYFEVAASSLSQIGRAGIFLTQNKNSVPQNIPENIYVSDYLPLSSFLDKCSLIVHHGGIGTTSQAIRSAVPQIIFYHKGLDQQNNGKIAETLGSAYSYYYRKLSIDLVIKSIEELTKEEVKESFLKLKDMCDKNSSKKQLINYINRIKADTM